MPEHETPHQGSFDIDPTQGAFVVPEAPIEPDATDAPISALRRHVIDPSIADGKRQQQAAIIADQAATTADEFTQLDVGIPEAVPSKHEPVVVLSGFAPMLGRVVRDDDDVRLQQEILTAKRAKEARQSIRSMPPEARQAGLNNIRALRQSMHPDGDVIDKEAQRQRAIELDRERYRTPPPHPSDISESA